MLGIGVWFNLIALRLLLQTDLSCLPLQPRAPGAFACVGQPIVDLKTEVGQRKMKKMKEKLYSRTNASTVYDRHAQRQFNQRKTNLSIRQTSVTHQLLSILLFEYKPE